jgi:hypothetical protein
MPAARMLATEGVSCTAKTALMFRAALKGWLKYGLRGGGIALFVIGLTCMPGPLVNPKATTSLFPVLAAGGLLIRYGAVMMVTGALLFGSSFLIHDDAR